MEQDLTLPVGDGYVNLRVGAILTRGEHVLMVRNDLEGYYYSVGGRIQFGECAEQAVIREAEEETGVRLEVDRLGFVEENYYYSDVRRRRLSRSAAAFHSSAPRSGWSGCPLTPTSSSIRSFSARS